MIKRGKKYCKLSELKVNVGETKLYLIIKHFQEINLIFYNLILIDIKSNIYPKRTNLSN